MCADAMALNEEEARKIISKIADMLQEQEWAAIIPEIPQTHIRFQKNKKRRSPYGEERKGNYETISSEQRKTD